MSTPDFGPPPASDFNPVPSADEVAYFRENGFLAVERLTTDEEIAWLRGIFEYIFDPANAQAEGAPLDRSAAKSDAEANKLAQSFFPEIQFPEILNSTFHRNAKRYASALLGIEPDRLTCWGHMIKKSPGGRSAPWHQDHAYWEPEFDYNALGVWLPMHDVSVEMGAMQFMPGSHKKGLVPHHHTERPADNLLEVDEKVDLSKAVPCPLKAGGATFHHAETFHYTAPNTTDRPRLAFPMEFQIKPVRRAVPAIMPWVDQKRAAIGRPTSRYVANGKVYELV